MLRMTKEREALNWSKSELARQAMMGSSSITAIELGRMNPYPAQIEKIVKALDWKDDPAKLFEDVGD